MASTSRTVRAKRSTSLRAALVVIGALSLAACGGSAGATSPADATTSLAPASAAPASAAASDSGAGSDTGSCGEATAALVMQQLARKDVVSVTTEGGCHDATIVTTLGPSDATTALAICDAAAPIAYAGDLSSVTVLAANDKELSIGIKGQPCIAEP